MAVPILWPRGQLRPQNVAFNIQPRNLMGPTSVSGVSQVTSSDAGIWTATYENVIIRNRDQVLAWRAIEGLLEGRLKPVLVPLCHAYQPNIDGVSFADGNHIPHSDGAFFSDGSGYRNGLTTSYNIGFVRPIRSTTAFINVVGGRIEPGMHFSVSDRLYRLTKVIYGSATEVNITFYPPLREEIVIGQEIEFDRPMCRMRLMTDAEMSMTLEMLKRSMPTVNFIEDV